MYQQEGTKDRTNDWQGRECVDAKQTIEENGICNCSRQGGELHYIESNDSYFVAIYLADSMAENCNDHG